MKIIKKDYKKKLVKDVKVFLKEKKKNSDNMFVNDTKVSKKMKGKSLLGIKKIIKLEKKPDYNCMKQLFLKIMT